MDIITANNLNTIQNEAFRSYASTYVSITQQFQEKVSSLGIEFESFHETQEKTKALRKLLEDRGCVFRNCGASLATGPLSPACEACATGTNSGTYYISLRCHRNCYFCFNPNQENYLDHCRSKRNWRRELAQAKESDLKLECIALTGGEPMLFPQETLDFFTFARSLYPNAHLRLYTSGDLLGEPYFQALANSGLDEIRFSIKLDGNECDLDRTFTRIREAKTYIPTVMVEMPVEPGSLPEMKKVLMRLESLRVQGINLLELCFPFRNAEAFSSRGFKLKNPPYLTYYNYWYAGGIPIAKSELECLALLEFALDSNFAMSVHYCSLENKNVAQIHQQNMNFKDASGTILHSAKDHFLKAVKTFGADALAAKSILGRAGRPCDLHEEHGFAQLHPNDALLLPETMELGLSYQICEQLDEEILLRELRLDKTSSRDLVISEL